MSTQKREAQKRETENLAAIFAGRLRRLIGDGSVSAFARRTGLRQASVDRYVKAAHAPNAEALRAIATRCGVTTDWLLGLADSPSGVPDETGLHRRLFLSEKKLARVSKALGHILRGTTVLQSIVDEGMEDKSPGKRDP